MSILGTHHQQHSPISVELPSVTRSYRHCAFHLAPTDRKILKSQNLLRLTVSPPDAWLLLVKTSACAEGQNHQELPSRKLLKSRVDYEHIFVRVLRCGH